MQGNFAQEFGFLNILKQGNSHHAILLPSVYSFGNCKLLLEYLLFKNNAQTHDSIISSPDSLFFTKFSQNEVPLTIGDKDTHNDGARLIVKFAYKTAFSKEKIIVIEDIDKATNNALNCLLKVLEEPPQNTKFYLIYSSLYNVPATIRSRCYTLYENIANEASFNSLSSLFALQKDYNIFVQCGYNFIAYNKLITKSGFGVRHILLQLSGYSVDADFMHNAIDVLETVLCNMQKEASNFERTLAIEEIAKRLVYLKKASNVFHTNKHTILIELAERIHEMAC